MISYSDPMKPHDLGWLFPAFGAPILVIALLLFGKPAKDLWILQDILPAFLIFSLLLGLSLLLGHPRWAVPNAAIALGLLATVPSLKYGFVYGEYDGLAHYSAALQIAQTGSLPAAGFYSTEYAPTPVLHVLLAVIGLTSGLPIEAVIACTLFLEHFLFLVLVAEAIRIIFPRMDRRLIAFITIMTLPVGVEMTGTTFGLLGIALFIYVFARMTQREAGLVYWLLGSMIFGLLLLSHFPTAVYFLTAVTGYAISVLAIRGLKRSGPKVSGDLLTRLLPIILVCFFAWLTYFGQPFLHVLRSLAIDLFVPAPSLPPTAAAFPLADLLQIFLFENGRFLFSALAAIAASSVAVIGFHKTKRFLMYWWLLAIATLIGGLIVESGLAAVRTWTSFAYASMVTPYFLCFLLSRGVRRGRLPSMPRFSVKALMFAVLVMSLVAAYPITPLYPQSGGRFILDDNSVNSIYVISGIRFFSSVYPQNKLITSDRIFHQLISLDPKLWGKTISLKLESVKSPTELKRELVLFDAGSRSGISTLAMSALAPNLRSTLGVVYSNGYFYIALAT